MTNEFVPTMDPFAKGSIVGMNEEVSVIKKLPIHKKVSIGNKTHKR